MSEMDWETSGQPFPAHPSMPRERCPYRPPTDAAGNFQFPGLLPQQANPNVPFHPQHATHHTFWDSISQQNMPPHEGMNNNRFVQMSTPHPPGRAPDIASFDYQMGLDGHSPPSGPTRHSRFDGSRPLPQRTRSYHNGMHSSAEAQAILALSANQSSSSGAIDLASSYNGGMARRNGSAAGMPQENGSSNVPASPSRHLPPPNPAYHGLFLGQNTAYPRQPRFSADGNAQSVAQSSTSAMPPHPPTLPRETSWTRVESGSRNSTHRTWFHETFYSTQNAEMDSDEESIEPQEESLRRQGRPDPHTLQLLHEQMRLAGGPRRVNPFDTEGPETSLERARAARRAAAAAVKFVASSAALASLEPVDLKTLTGDERSCIICYNEFGVKNPDGFIECPVRLPKCRHIFGDRCLKQWLQDSDSCPYCRDKLPSEPKRNQQQDDVRRFIAQSRLDPWYAAEVSRLQADTAAHAAAAEREQQYQQLMQQRQERREDSSDDILARMRRREDYDWSTSFNQSSIGLPSRSMPDYDGRRRYRGRHSVSRAATQAAGRANGPNSTRSARNVNLQSGPLRAPVHSSTPSFDENSGSQRRSVTPHPTIAGIPTWSSPPQLQSTASGRPSSLPTERSPLGEATEVRPNALSSRTPSGSSTMSTSLLDTPWIDNHQVANNALVSWRVPTTANGRPASTSFINDMPQSRLQQLHEDLDSLGVHIQNHRLPPYMTAPNDADADIHMGSMNRR